MRRPVCIMTLVLLGVFFIFFKCNSNFLREDIPNEKYCTLQGKVVAKEYQEDTLVITLRNVTVLETKAEYEGALCYIADASEPKLGSIIQIYGQAADFNKASNPGEFDAKKYYKILKLDFSLKAAKLLKESIKYSRYKEFLFRVKCQIGKIYEYYLNDNDSGLLKAVILGSKKDLSKTQKKLYQMNGISHIMAISGMHITILGFGLYRALKKCKFPRFIASALPIILIIAYGQMVGSTSSSVRAIMMFSLKLTADYLGRKYDILTALSLACITVLIEQPLYIFHAGFLLSFSAILGITLFPRNIKKNMTLVSKTIYEAVTANLCIFLFQLPVVLSCFYEYPLISIVNNVLIVPLIPGLIAMGLVLIPYYYIGIAWGILPFFIHIFIWMLESLCKLSTNIPGLIWVAGKPNEINIIIYYSIILFSIYFFTRLKEKNDYIPNVAKCVLVISSVLILVYHPNHGLDITYLSMGQGNCAYINCENEKRYLIDGGSVSNNKSGEYTLLPFLRYSGAGKLDGIFLTHLDTDHISAIKELLENTNEIRVKEIYIASAAIKDEEFYEFINLCDSKKVKVVFLQEGDYLKTGNLKINIYHPDKDLITTDRNAYSLVIGLEYKNFHALFSGDVDSTGEEETLKNLPLNYKCDVFLATHHGSKYSNTQIFLDGIRPACTVISCGKNNSYGHPHKEALERIESVNSKIYKTMDCGAVMVESDGTKFKISTYN